MYLVLRGILILTFLIIVGCGKQTIEMDVLNGLSSNGATPASLTAADDIINSYENITSLDYTILTNDLSSGGETPTITAVEGVTGGPFITSNGGTVTITNDGSSVGYQPAVNFRGSESFTYTISNGDVSVTATVTVHVLSPFTWTGDAGDDLFTNNGNWCGTFDSINRICNNDSTSSPTLGDNVVFGGSCINCNASINASANVNSFTLDTSYEGTITQSNGTTLTVDSVPSFTQKGGNFIGGDANSHLDINEFTLTGGNFTAPQGTLSVGYEIASNTDGFTVGPDAVFNHNTGTILFNGSGSENSYSQGEFQTTVIDVDNSIEFYNLIVEVRDTHGGPNYFDGIALGITDDDVVVVNNDLTINNGFLRGGRIKLKGDLYINCADGNSLTSDVCAEGGLTDIVISGDSAQEYHVQPGGRAPHLIIDTTGTFTAAAVPATTELNAFDFTLENGTFNAPSGNFSIGYMIRNVHQDADFQNTEGLVINGGNFNHNNGTVIFDGSNHSFDGTTTGSSISSTISARNLSLNNLTVNVRDIHDGGGWEDVAVHLSASTDLTIEGDLVIDNGSIQNGNIFLEGNYVMNCADGDFQSTDVCSEGVNSSLTFSGTSNQNVTQTTGTRLITQPLTFQSGSITTLLTDVTLNNVNMSVEAGATLNMDGFNLTGINSITDSSGTINKSGGTLTYSFCTVGGCP